MSIGTGAAIALGVGAAATAAGGIGSALINKSAAQKASAQQTQSGQAAIDEQKRQFDITQGNLAPWLTAGQGGLAQLVSGTQPGGALVTPFGETYNTPAPFSYAAFDPGAAFTAPTLDNTNDPGYAFRLQQSQQALTRAAAASGGAFSGGTVAALTRAGQDYASNEYQNVYNRALTGYNTNFNDRLNSYSTNLAGALNTYNTNVNTGLNAYNTRFNAFNTGQTNTYNRLAALSGSGQTAGSTLATTGAAEANAVANLITEQGNAQAGGTLGQGAAVNQGINSVTGAIGGGINSYLTGSLLSSLMGGSNKNPSLPAWVGAPLGYQG
ncbi:MAG TPA: hypothetical protein VGR63_02540 [Casimicrobiaceae bacterium]|jgi:hypothetical protein|nr:hypothetical protein [Casimicrobiaceae bacterium]